jgi:4-hydroxy-tetrahydrodipicolinate synthase
MTDFPFPGLNLAVTTPFDAQGRVDLGALVDHLERYIAAGVDGIVLSSGTGMHVYLSREESDALVARGARIVAGRARVIVQTSALMVEDVVARTRHAADRGADGVMILPPFFEGPTDDADVLAFYTAAAEGGLPIIGYNVPQALGVGI